MSLPPNIPPDRNEARRRAAADPLLASAMRAADAAGVGECLDVETLGLYADRVLRGAALVQARTHVEQCERCRSILAFVEKADATADGAAAGGGAWAWLTGWRWLVPAASVAAVAVVAVWVNRAPTGDVAAPAGPETTVAATRPSEQAVPPPVASSLRDGLAGSAAGATAAAQERARSNDAVAAPAASGRAAVDAAPTQEKALADAAARPSATARNAAGGAADPARAEELERRQGVDLRAAAPAEAVGGLAAGSRPVPPIPDVAAPAAAAQQSAAAPPPSPLPSTPPPAAASPAAPSPAAPQAATPTAASAEARAEAAARPAAATAGAAGDTPIQAARAADAFVAKRADAVSGVWRVREGRVERQRAGAWQRVTTPDDVTVVAISSPSREVCWAIGATDILRTWNGDTWTRVAPPETSEPLRAVSATDASTAVVTTASGVRFRTSNGGSTWTRL